MNRTDRRNTDTSSAIKKNIESADVFAKDIVSRLDDFEDKNKYIGFEFESLSHRADHLNDKGVKTRRGKKWTKSAISRVLKRVENMKCNLS